MQCISIRHRYTVYYNHRAADNLCIQADLSGMLCRCSFDSMKSVALATDLDHVSAVQEAIDQSVFDWRVFTVFRQLCK